MCKTGLSLSESFQQLCNLEGGLGRTAEAAALQQVGDDSKIREDQPRWIDGKCLLAP